jgi:hypothetical protein
MPVFDEPVGVKEQPFTRLKQPVPGGEAVIGGRAQHGACRVVEVLGLPGPGGDKRRRMPGVGVAEVTSGRVEYGVDDAGEHVWQEMGQGGVDPL